jgi:Ran GTPase-activating protein (RanGAP) involved in mRNA processing and transport
MEVWKKVQLLIGEAKLPLLQVSDEQEEHGVEMYRFSQITYQEFFAAVMIVDAVCHNEQRVGVAQLLGVHVGWYAFGVTKWHNVLLFCSELLSLRDDDAMGDFSDKMSGAASKLVIYDQVGLPGAKAMAPFLRCNQSMAGLDLSHAELGAEGSAVLGDAICANVKVWPYVAREQYMLCVCFCGLQRSFLLVCPLPTHHRRQLRKLSLAGLHADDIAQIIAKNHTIEELSISGSTTGFLDEAAAEKIATAIHQNRVLRALTFKSGGAFSKPVTMSAGSNEIDVSSTGLGHSGALVVGAWLHKCQSLALLKMANNKLGPEGIAAVVRPLLKCASLTELSLAGNRLEAGGMAAVADLMRDNATLVSLDLSSTFLVADQEAVQHLVDAIQANGALTRLDLCNNGRFVHAGMSSIAEALGGNASIQHLNLAGNALGVAGAQSVAGLLRVNQSLTSVDVSKNDLCPRVRKNGFWSADMSGMAALVESFKTNSRLTHIDVSNNGMPAKSTDEIHDALAVVSAFVMRGEAGSAGVWLRR